MHSYLGPDFIREQKEKSVKNFGTFTTSFKILCEIYIFLLPVAISKSTVFPSWDLTATPWLSTLWAQRPLGAWPELRSSEAWAFPSPSSTCWWKRVLLVWCLSKQIRKICSSYLELCKFHKYIYTTFTNFSMKYLMTCKGLHWCRWYKIVKLCCHWCFCWDIEPFF